MSQNEKPTLAFVLSLIAGILIIISGAISAVVSSFISGFIPGLPEATIESSFAGLSIVSAVYYVLLAVGNRLFGILVFLGALMIYLKPSQKTAWGVVILVFSIISIVTGGGFIIGLILGIIGGALALAWKPKVQTIASTTT